MKSIDYSLLNPGTQPFERHFFAAPGCSFASTISFPCPALRCPASVAASMKYLITNSLIAVDLATPISLVRSM